ncbi:hypothetical protein [Aliamphritea spongicola]|nr:hypothetical protein [Aliamphritea spongicola]
MDSYIQLDRQFKTISHSEESTLNSSLLSTFGFNTGLSWENLLKKYRCVILAEAGAGKTFELKTMAETLVKQNRFAFLYV